LDTQWRWSYPQVIRQYIPNTMWENFSMFEKYPNYVFNFTGANRYRFMKEYFPQGFEDVRHWVAKGRWFPAGSCWEESDVNVPSTESIIRQVLFGQRFFEKEFGTESAEYMLPDCFGFPASLPSVLAHCGMRGFSTAKLTWGSAVGIPFNVGVWEGPDGESVIAALNPGKYDSRLEENLSLSDKWRERIDRNGQRSGVYADYLYYGVGDRGGAPEEPSIQWIEKSIASNGPVRVISSRADQMFRDITDVQKANLPRYKGDLLLTEHSAGSITSQAYMKRWNRLNETLAEAAEKASVAAHLLCAAPYPREKINRAWQLVLGAQMHDILPGTSVPKAYEFSWNDEAIAMNCFASVLEDAVGGVARALDTQTDGVPLVVFNPLSIDREDLVEAEVELPGGGLVQVLDADGKPLLTQVLSHEGNKQRILFVGKVPSIGFAVFAVKKANVAMESTLKVSDLTLENARYRVTVNDAGDIASVFDKKADRELLAAPARLAFQTENPREYPAWNMDWQDRQKPPRGYVRGPAKIHLVESGPVRVAIEVERETENSVFVQSIRLSVGDAGNRVEVFNRIDWQSKACSLKAEFPLTVANPTATYNWELGKVERANNDPKKYEVPSHQWFDLTDPHVNYGVTILAPTKYGSDKPADNTLCLTLLYTPGAADTAAYVEQRTQDWGRHEFVYGISGHRGDWRAGKSDWQAARIGQPMFAFRTASHPGKLGRQFSLLRSSSDQVMVRTVKLAEDNDQVIVRLQELNGTPARNVRVSASADLKTASQVNGLERAPKQLQSDKDGVTLDFKPYQLQSLACTFVPHASLPPGVSKPIKLPYNIDVFSFNELKQDGAFDNEGATFPAEMISDTLVSEGINFNIGPRKNGGRNAVSCRGQNIRLPPGDYDRLYLLACAANGDAEAFFMVDGAATSLRIQDWSGFLGLWDNRVFEFVVPEVSFAVRNPLQRILPGYIKRQPLAWFSNHRHQRSGQDQIYTYCYLFKYSLDLPKGAKMLTLPDSPRIRIFAATVARNVNDDTRAAQPLYDDLSTWPPSKPRVAGQ
jgi:alpha-mannosidase